MAMLRHARRTGTADRVHLVVSVRTPEDLYYASELPGPEVTVVHTRRAPAGDPRPPGRLALGDLPPLAPDTTAYVCGSTAFAEAASAVAVAAGVPVTSVRVERFGPSG